MWRLREFLLTFVIRITVFVKKREKLIPIILYIYAAVDSCSATFYYLKLYCKMGDSKNLPRWAAEFGKRRRGIWQNLPRKTVGPIHHIYFLLSEVSLIHTNRWRWRRMMSVLGTSAVRKLKVRLEKFKVVILIHCHMIYRQVISFDFCK